ncbi:phosphatase PAP2 family protein [Moraxella bovis]|uniref:phosphatase PAP2 family protein n=2 Tax=Moraxella bovis TaxID=476 RepID=UPI0022268568|nr:phosphatase PAP2 family protein [Moraxella bovis]UZA09649.1 phosphatase PAP2 family protein [Moraxella bovis]UZA34095.1 phosphatase PAP2 family protein [Moraxella bovis]
MDLFLLDFGMNLAFNAVYLYTLAIMNDDLKQRTMALVKALVVFGLAYPLTNDYTHALMSHTPTAVGSVASRYDVVPFVAWAIVPYSLSFVLFVLSFYVVSSAMLSRLLHRLVLGTLVACLCFYVYPLVFAYDRPVMSEHWRWAYELLSLVDKPYNQLPSLHACYALLFGVNLWHVVQGRWRGLYRAGLSLICVAIAGATLFTWQHHVADVVAGLGLAVVVLVAERWLHALPHITGRAMMKFITLGVLWFLGWAVVPVLVGYQGTAWAMMAKIMGMYGCLGLFSVAWLYAKPSWITSLLAKQTDKHHVGAFRSSAYGLGLPIIIIYKLMWRLAWACHFVCHDIGRRAIHTQAFTIMAIGHLSDDVLDELSQYAGRYRQILWVDVCAEMASDFAHARLLADKRTVTKWQYVNLGVMDLQYFDDTIMNNVKALYDDIKQADEPNTLIICQCAMGQSRSVAVMICLLALQQSICPHRLSVQDKEMMDSVLSSYGKHRARGLLA